MARYYCDERGTINVVNCKARARCKVCRGDVSKGDTVVELSVYLSPRMTPLKICTDCFVFNATTILEELQESE